MHAVHCRLLVTVPNVTITAAAVPTFISVHKTKLAIFAT